MTLTDYRDTYAWRQALDLAPHLVRLSEQLPDSEAAGLAIILRTFAIEAPGSIAADLVTGSHDALPVMLRIVAALEVIERVYPALDTTAARNAADTLALRVEGGDFTEREAAASVSATDDDSAETTDHTDPVETPVIAAPEPEPEPLSPPPAPTPSPEVVAPTVAPEPSTVQLTPTVEGMPSPVVPIIAGAATPTSGDPIVVHPDSAQ